MALTAEQIVTIRRKVGNAPSDAVLNETYGRLADVDAVVLEVLEIRLAELRRTPASFAIPGEYSQSTAENLRALEEMVASLGGGGYGATIIPAPRRPCR